MQTAALLKVFMCSVLTYTLTITSIKISLLVLYRRLFDIPAFRKRSLIVGIACLLWGVIAIFTTIFQCRPFTAAFDPASLVTYHCINIESYYIGMVAANLGLDIIMLLLPLHMVWKLQLPVRQRVALSGIFSIGLLPLFNSVNLSVLKKISSIVRFGKKTSLGGSEAGNEDLERRTQYHWPAAHGLRTPMSYQAMHAKVTKHGNHVVAIRHHPPATCTVCKSIKPDRSQFPKPKQDTATGAP
ncbi:MAG: hypothetical protein Q9184_006764 [Pyrenodesmia sp. 2 TL-2023]